MTHHGGSPKTVGLPTPVSTGPAISDALIRRIARGDIPGSDLQRECQAHFVVSTAMTPTKQALKTLMHYAREHKSRGQFGRFGAALVVGAAVLGDPFLDRLNVERLLVVAGRVPRFESALTDFARRLATAEEPGFRRLRERFETYGTLYRLRLTIEARFADAIAALRKRPFEFGKTVLAVANRAFLRRYFDFAEHELDDTYKSFRSAEDVAAAASSIIALANDERALESMDFTFPMAGLASSALFTQLLSYGHAIATLAEAEKHIATLDYRLAVSPAGRRTVFSLTPPSPDLEYAIRLGFVRGEIGQNSSRLHVARDGMERYSVLAAVDRLIDALGDKLFDIKDPDTRLRRLVLKVPLLPQMFSDISRWRFYEDAVMDERLAQELELPMQFKGDEPWELAPGLDIHAFQRTWRVLDFLSLVDVALIKRHQDDPQLISNSMMRVISRDKVVEMLTTFGLSGNQASAFLDLVSARTSKLGHYDVQYRPFLALEPSTLRVDDKVVTTPVEVVHAPAVVALANVVPNVQRAHSIRVAANAEALVAVAAEHLKPLARAVRTNVSVKDQSRRTDVDVVVLGDDTLYLFECKHSMTPTDAHEFRDLWGDINKGVSQLESAMDILRVRLPNYLAGWFPGADRNLAARLKVKPCVLCSHRVFSGLTIRGVPVRDHASFTLILGDATVQMGFSEDGEQVTLKRYRLRPSQNPTLADLDNYMSEDSTFFQMFRPFMHAFTAVEHLSESIILARDAFMYQVSEEGWISRLEELGAVRLADETLKLGPSAPPQTQ